MRLSYLLATLLCLTMACSDDNTTTDGSVSDAVVSDAGPDTNAGGDATATDAGANDAAGAVPCPVDGGTCPGSLTCLCCGSRGPSEICLCSKACTGESSCAGTGLPECNTANSADAGICTPAAYNCCWGCN